MSADDAKPSPTLPGITLGDLRLHERLSLKMKDGSLTADELQQLATVVAKEKKAARSRPDLVMYVRVYETIESSIDRFRRRRGW
ncbi:MAG TPA: hypothetical protein VMG99_08945 [Thermoplasmata archaeon]|nr:hypothetical protein [Thermoplasmata archaeon]